MEVFLKQAAEFNAGIKYLARVYALKKKGTFEEAQTLRNSTRINMLIAAEPLCLIEECGPFFLRYAEDIKHRRWTELLKHDFIDEKKEFKKSSDGVNHTNDTMDSKIKFIKNVFISSSTEEREAMGDKIASCLSAYCIYALEAKKKKK